MGTEQLYQPVYFIQAVDISYNKKVSGCSKSGKPFLPQTMGRGTWSCREATVGRNLPRGSWWAEPVHVPVLGQPKPRQRAQN